MNTMSLMPWRPRLDEDSGFLSLQRAMNSLFDDFLPVAELPRLPANGALWNPRVDMMESDKELVVTAELPGIEERDVDVSLVGDMLTIKGQKQAASDEKGKTFHRMERIWGSFQRTLSLPYDVDRNAIKAVFNKGVLTVTLPKTEGARQSVRKIPIKAAS